MESLPFEHQATAFQKTRFDVQWPVFDRYMVDTEIELHRMWNMVKNGIIACNCATRSQDPPLLVEHNVDPTIYFHRKVTNPHFRRRHRLRRIVECPINYAADLGKKYVHLDAVGENQKLIAPYESCGFEMIAYGS